MNNASQSDSFIFVKSKPIPHKQKKSPAWITEPFEKEYSCFSAEEEDWVSKGMNQQITATVSAVQSKQLRDNEMAYVVLGLETQFVSDSDSLKPKQVFSQNTTTVIRRLSAQILCYLTPEHNKLLIACPLSSLEQLIKKEKYSKVYFKVVRRISPLFLDEQISSDLKDSQWATGSKDILIELVPNLSIEKKQEYASKLIQNLEVTGVYAESCCDNDFILASLNQQLTEQLLEVSNYVFRVSEIPKGLLAKAELPKKNKRSNLSRRISGLASSISTQKSSDQKPPVVCVLDSGVNEIPQLNDILIGKDGFRKFSSFDDDYKEQGHGTPVAYLSAFGENSNYPTAKIVSYKIYSHSNKQVYIDGYKLAILKYSNKENPKHSRLFVSSILFEKYDAGITALIDSWIQENNICAIFPTGNIDRDTIIDFAQKGTPCTSYICRYPVQDPAQALNALTIGAVAKRESPNSISHKNELSPFTRCGTNNGSSLYDCQKPEFVENGGNYCKDGTGLGLRSIDKQGKESDDFVGTSFSAPIFTNYLAQILARYGDKFDNAETLKAIAFALSSGEAQKCRGFGETKRLDDFNHDLQALVCSEGKISLLDTVSDKDYKIWHTAQISVAVPKLVNSIKLFLVHSDNHFTEAMPHLNTFLTVRVTKTARDYGYPEPINKPEIDKKSNMKVLKWAYESQSMEGTWDFLLKPEITADMLPEHRRATTVRYGCAVLVNSKTLVRDKPLTQQVYDLNKQIGVVL